MTTATIFIDVLSSADDERLGGFILSNLSRGVATGVLKILVALRLLEWRYGVEVVFDSIEDEQSVKLPSEFSYRGLGYADAEWPSLTDFQSAYHRLELALKPYRHAAYRRAVKRSR